jgi:hypothetical protein
VQGEADGSVVTYINVIYRVTNELNLLNEKKTKVYFHPRKLIGRRPAREVGSGTDTRGPAAPELPTDIKQTA